MQFETVLGLVEIATAELVTLVPGAAATAATAAAIERVVGQVVVVYEAHVGQPIDETILHPVPVDVPDQPVTDV